MFKAFKPQAINKIAGAMGYQGNMNQFQQFIEQDPARQQQMNMYMNAARQMARGGYARRRFATGGTAGTGTSNYGTVKPTTIPTKGDPNDFLDFYNPQPELPVAGPAPLPPVETPVEEPPASNRGTTTNVSGTQAATPTYTGAPETRYTITPATYYQEGDVLPEGVQVGDEKTPETRTPVEPGVATFTTEQAYNPALPVGGTTIAAETPTDATQDIAKGTGEVSGDINVETTKATENLADEIEATTAATYTSEASLPAVTAELDKLKAATIDPDDPRAEVIAEEQTTTAVSDLDAAQGEAILMKSPVQRKIQEGELIGSGVADAEKAAKYTEEIQAAEATPSKQATVAGQLETLMQGFEGGKTPSWAAGAMRTATANMAARGLGASSLAGQAIIQAAMEAALPIAKADAATVAEFDLTNLSNRQERAMLTAKQRADFMDVEFDQDFQARVKDAATISDIADTNFTAEQTVQLENSQLVNSMEIANLDNKQALVIAEASALTGLESDSLSNRQQAAVKNAESFLDMELSNVANEQQTAIVKAEQNVQAIFTDQAERNAAEQFNATSENQTTQFYKEMESVVSQFNASVKNAISEFNAGEANTADRFNAEINSARDQFNASNQLIIEQSNAEWRRSIATADTEALNRAHELNANAILDVSKTAYDNLWNYFNDTMEWAWTAGENDKDRVLQMALGELSAKASADMAQLKLDAEESGIIGGFFTDLLFSDTGGGFFSGLID